MKTKLEHLPLGFCGECLARMLDGQTEYQGVRLPNGDQLIHAYCAHREAGAELRVRAAGGVARWRITTPIDVFDWQALVAVRAPMLANVLRLDETPPASPTPGDGEKPLH